MIWSVLLRSRVAQVAALLVVVLLIVGVVERRAVLADRQERALEAAQHRLDEITEAKERSHAIESLDDDDFSRAIDGLRRTPGPR
ncbi:MAG: hypothetical protein AAGK79_13345 [Pseudomonadota bacterium]